jgi:hypothetical protein
MKIGLHGKRVAMAAVALLIIGSAVMFGVDSPVSGGTAALTAAWPPLLESPSLETEVAIGWCPQTAACSPSERLNSTDRWPAHT